MNKTNFTMLVGLPASGKSTFAKTLIKSDKDILISSDTMRIKLFGDINNQDRNEELFQYITKEIKHNLSIGNNVIYDATNINYKRRKQLLHELKKYNTNKECYVMALPYETCIKRNELRDRKVPIHIIKDMYLNFYIPQYYEGWDKISFKFDDGFKSIDFNILFNNPINGLNILPHDNPHHSLTIGKHCYECFMNLIKNPNIETYALVGLCHDIGKGFTKSFCNYKGQSSEYAHYYNHENVSAYLTMLSLGRFCESTENEDAYLKIIGLVQWHMKPFFLKNAKQKTIDKFTDLVGEEFYKDLMILHEADVKAH